jgi:uncharacterized protein YdeI (YjbR/CyaY-like superfamily)
MLTAINITFFKDQKQFRKWLEKHHKKANELWVGFYKKETGKPSITWKESVDEALCFGWIDGIRKRIDGERYTIRFTPRNPKSNWSKINTERIIELKKLGLVKDEGWELFGIRDKAKSEEYSFEQRNNIKLPAVYQKNFKANKKAWNFFLLQSPWYRRTVTWWVVSAKQEVTRLRRFNQLISDSESSRTIPQLTRKKSS